MAVNVGIIYNIAAYANQIRTALEEALGVKFEGEKG